MDGSTYAAPAGGPVNMPMAFPPLPEDTRQQLQNKLPFQQESGRNPTPQFDAVMANASSMPSSYQSQQAFANASDKEFKDRLHRAAKNIETKIKSEVEDCRNQLRKDMMYAGVIIALVLGFLTWRSFRR